MGGTVEAKEILSKLAAKLPKGVGGVDKQNLVAKILGETPASDVAALRETLNSLLFKMEANKASDIDLGGHGCKGSVWYRIFGEKKPDTSLGTLTPDESDFLLQSILTESQREHLCRERNLDFSFVAADAKTSFRFRGDMYFDLDSLALNMRIIANAIRPFTDLELHPNIARALAIKFDKHGLILVTGLTGAGKSTTLDSIIDLNNQTSTGHIVIIGSPIETVHQPSNCIVRHREVGKDVLSFKEGAIQALRQDPNIVVVGEMRDPETILTVLEITDSGHKVFSTLHTASAVESIDRIIGECAVEEQNRVRERLADTLKCVLSQKLVPTVDGKRVLAKEVMLMTSSIRAAIKNNNSGEIFQMIFESADQGMTTLEQDLKRLFAKGRISREEAMNYANNKKRLDEILKE
ncbi:MAG: ATPase, T2SS/T4P/T4SS family [Candidatus Eisenbacteria bacterium]|nr:ATPase, T2SS/T4P/T4SS family [Candidatus Eisenbacteria bacterium]